MPPRVRASGPRIEPADWRSCRPDVAELLRAGEEAGGGSSNVNGILAKHPGLYKRFAPFAAKLLYGGRLPSTDREVLVLRTAWRTRSEYQWVHHVRYGRAAGLDDAVIEAVREPGLSETLSAFQRVLVRAADLLIDEHELDEATYRSLREAYDDPQLIELVMLVGHYTMLAGLLNTLGVELEPHVRTPQPQ